MTLTAEERHGIRYHGKSLPQVPDHTWSFTNMARAFPIENRERFVVAEISVSLDHNGGGTSGEFAIRWIGQRHSRPPAQIQAYYDAWEVLELCNIVNHLRNLEDGNPTVDQVENMLTDLGMRNDTDKYLKEQQR